MFWKLLRSDPTIPGAASPRPSPPPPPPATATEVGEDLRDRDRIRAGNIAPAAESRHTIATRTEKSRPGKLKFEPARTRIERIASAVAVSVVAASRRGANHPTAMTPSPLASSGAVPIFARSVFQRACGESLWVLLTAGPVVLCSE